MLSQCESKDRYSKKYCLILSHEIVTFCKAFSNIYFSYDAAIPSLHTIEKISDITIIHSYALSFFHLFYILMGWAIS